MGHVGRGRREGGMGYDMALPEFIPSFRGYIGVNKCNERIGQIACEPSRMMKRQVELLGVVHCETAATIILLETVFLASCIMIVMERERHRD